MIRYDPREVLRAVQSRAEGFKSYQAQGRVVYKGEGGSGSFDFGAYISADSLRLHILTPFGLPLADLLLRPDTLYLLDYGTSTLFLLDPSSSLEGVWGLGLAPAQILDLFRLRLPEGEPSEITQDGVNLVFRYEGASYQFSARTHQLLRYESSGLVAQFQDYDTLALRPRRIYIRSSGEELRIRIKGQALNPGVAPGRFVLDLPLEVTVYDLMGE